MIVLVVILAVLKSHFNALLFLIRLLLHVYPTPRAIRILSVASQKCRRRWWWCDSVRVLMMVHLLLPCSRVKQLNATSARSKREERPMISRSTSVDFCCQTDAISTSTFCDLIGSTRCSSISFYFACYFISQISVWFASKLAKTRLTRICAAEMAVRYAALSPCRKVYVCHCNSLGGATWR